MHEDRITCIWQWNLILRKITKYKISASRVYNSETTVQLANNFHKSFLQ